MIEFPCQVCQTKLSTEDGQAGQLVRCPTCLTAQRVPAPQTQLVGAGSPGLTADVVGPTDPATGISFTSSGHPIVRRSGRMGAGKRYPFLCAYCSSHLEATESMAATEGQCPTCGNQITVPILDRYGRLIDPKTREIIKQDPHPVHAYAAAGERAPRIIRNSDSKQAIQCPRCRGISLISSNNCKHCGVPFTMEGTTIDASGSTNGFCVASLVLGIIGLPAWCSVVVPLLAVVLGIVGLTQTVKSGGTTAGKGMAVAGIILGAIGGAIAGYQLL
jgi:DNA-directed RNA polymerase subunit RPC12/RpoP